MPFPIQTAHRLLLESGSLILLEDNTSKIILDEQIALDDPLTGATSVSATPSLTFVGEDLRQPQQLQVASGVNTAFASSVLATFKKPMAPGSIILLAWEGDGVSATNVANTPTDTAGNLYSRLVSKNLAATFDLEVWYAVNNASTPNNVVTVTDTGAGIDSIVSVEEWANLITISPLDQSASNTGSSTALSSGASSVTINPFDLVWVAGVAAISGNHLSLAGSFSLLNQNSTTFSNLGTASMLVKTTGAQTGLMTVSSPVSWACIVVALKGVTVPLGLHYEVEVDTVNTFDSQ